MHVCARILRHAYTHTHTHMCILHVCAGNLANLLQYRIVELVELVLRIAYHKLVLKSLFSN